MDNQSLAPAIIARPEYVSTQAGETSAAGPLEFWRALRRRKGAVILFAFGGALAGFLWTLPQTPIYQARTSIEIVGVNDNFLNTKQVNPVTETGTTSETTDLQTQIRILLSESLLGRVLDKLGDDKALDLVGLGFVATWRRAFHVAEQPAIDRREAALANAQRGVKVRASGLTRILEITADSADPAAAAKFANTLAGEFISQNLEARWKSTGQTSQWLTQQLEEMRLKLKRSEDALQAYARESGLSFTAEHVSVSEDELGRLQQSLSAAKAERMARQSRYEMALASPPDALAEVLNDESLRDYQAKLTELKRQIAELGATFMPEHPKMMRAQAQLATLESALERARGETIKRIDNEYEEAKRKEALISSAYSELAQKAAGESEKAIQYNILKREVDSNRQLYDTLLQQWKQSTMAAAVRASNVRVVDPARVPKRPYKPDALLNVELGLLAGIVVGAVFVILRDRADRSVRQPGDTPLYLNLPELGVIPTGGPGRTVRQLARLRLGPKQPVELIMWQRKPSLISESFRSVLLSILFSGEGAGLRKVLAVTSAGPGEGKSTVVSNLGIAIAEMGKKVLLIDADLRKPRLQQIFGMANEHGLSEVLREPEPLNGSGRVEELIRQTEVPGLFVLTSGLTSGPSATTASALLYGPRMPELLRRLRPEFETILIDTPPMLQLHDARAIGRAADRVILVVRCGKTSRDAVVAASLRICEDGAKILGTILNDWDPNALPSGRPVHNRASYKSFKKHYASKGAHA